MLLILYSFSFFKILPTLTTLFCLRIKRSEGDLHFVRGNNQPSTPPPELSRGFSKRCEGGAEAKQHFALCAVERPRGSPTQRFRYQMPPPPLLSRGRLPPFPLSHALPWGCVTFPLFPSGRRGRVLPNPCRRAGTRGSRVRGGAGQGPASVQRGPPQAAMMAATGSRSREVASYSGEGERGGENGSAPLSLAADRRRPAEVA